MRDLAAKPLVNSRARIFSPPRKLPASRTAFYIDADVGSALPRGYRGAVIRERRERSPDDVTQKTFAEGRDLFSLSDSFVDSRQNAGSRRTHYVISYVYKGNKDI